MALLPAPSARGQDVWTVTGADFAEQRLAVLSVDDQSVRVRNVAGEALTLSWNSLLELDRGLSAAARQAARPAGLVLCLANGDRIAGQPAGMADESIQWNAAFGMVTIALRDVRQISSPAAETVAGAADDAPLQDTVLLANGDRLSGVVDTVDAESLRLSVDGEITPLPWDSVVSVQFASTGEPVRAADPVNTPPRGFRVTLAGDSRLTVRSVATAGDQLKLIGAAGERSVPLKGVLAIEHLNGPVLWLTSIPPQEATHDPYFARLRLPPRLGRNVTGTTEIRAAAGDRAARAGVGMASASRITWTLPDGYAAFRGQAAVDGNLPHANMVLRVRLDDRVAWELAEFTAASPPPLIVLPLQGSRTLTLEVDYGKTLDVQDRVNWIEPALLRQAPATPPSASPAEPATQPAG